MLVKDDQNVEKLYLYIELPHLCPYYSIFSQVAIYISNCQNIYFNWKEAYQMAFQCTKSAKLITFNFKFLQKRISANNFLKKIGLVDSEKCTFCERETEKLVHLFWACPKTQFFWTNFKVWLTVLPSHC